MSVPLTTVHSLSRTPRTCTRRKRSLKRCSTRINIALRRPRANATSSSSTASSLRSEGLSCKYPVLFLPLRVRKCVRNIFMLLLLTFFVVKISGMQWKTRLLYWISRMNALKIISSVFPRIKVCTYIWLIKLHTRYYYISHSIVIFSGYVKPCVTRTGNDDAYFP